MKRKYISCVNNAFCDQLIKVINELCLLSDSRMQIVKLPMRLPLKITANSVKIEERLAHILIS